MPTHIRITREERERELDGARQSRGNSRLGYFVDSLALRSMLQVRVSVLFGRNEREPPFPESRHRVPGVSLSLLLLLLLVSRCFPSTIFEVHCLIFDDFQRSGMRLYRVAQTESLLARFRSVNLHHQDTISMSTL